MKAARLIEPNRIEFQNIPIPELGFNDVLCDVKSAGICGTDLAIYSGESLFVKRNLVKFPLTLGHEWSGIVNQVGEGVKTFKPGDRVVGDTAISCGVCFECLKGTYLNCSNAHPVGTVNAIDGAFAESIIMPERHLFRLPDNLSFHQGALVEPVATGAYSVERGGVKPGDVVVVQGTGPIGLAAVQYAKLAGAAKVILTGRKIKKLDIGKKLGADVVVNTGTDDMNEVILDETNRIGPHVVIEATGSVDILKQSMQLVRPSGVVSAVAFYETDVDTIDLSSFILKNGSLISVAGSPCLGHTVLNLMEVGRINMESIITHEYQLDDLVPAINSMMDNNEERIKIMINV